MMNLNVIFCKPSYLTGQNGRTEKKLAEKLLREMLRSANLTGSFQIGSSYNPKHPPVSSQILYLIYNRIIPGGKGIGIKAFINGKEIDLQLKHEKIPATKIKESLDASFGSRENSGFRFELPDKVEAEKVAETVRSVTSIEKQVESNPESKVEEPPKVQPPILERPTMENPWKNLKPKKPARMNPTDTDCLRVVLWTILVEVGNDLSVPAGAGEIFDWVCEAYPITKNSTPLRFGRITARLVEMGLLSMKAKWSEKGPHLNKEKSYTLTAEGIEVAKGRRDIPELPKVDKNLWKDKEKVGEILVFFNILLTPAWFDTKKAFEVVRAGTDIEITEKELGRLLQKLAEETFYLKYNKAGKVFQLTSCGIAAAEMLTEKMFIPTPAPILPEDERALVSDDSYGINPIGDLDGDDEFDDFSDLGDAEDNKEEARDVIPAMVVSSTPSEFVRKIKRLKMLYELRKEIAEHVEALDFAIKTRTDKPSCRLREFAGGLEELDDVVAICEAADETFLQQLFS